MLLLPKKYIIILQFNMGTTSLTAEKYINTVLPSSLSNVLKIRIHHYYSVVSLLRAGPLINRTLSEEGRFERGDHLLQRSTESGVN